jgi:hypothetical protein
LWWRKKFHSRCKIRDEKFGIVSTAIASMSWSPRKVGGNKRSIIETYPARFIEVFDDEKEKLIANEQNNHPLVVDNAQTKERKVVELFDARTPQKCQ